MKSMNNLKQTFTQKLSKTLIDLGEKSARDCVLFGVYEPKISVELLKNISK